jgi:hypothetical protein
MEAVTVGPRKGIGRLSQQTGLKQQQKSNMS